jgi:hypothetical protein
MTVWRDKDIFLDRVLNLWKDTSCRRFSSTAALLLLLLLHAGEARTAGVECPFDRSNTYIDIGCRRTHHREEEKGTALPPVGNINSK